MEDKNFISLDEMKEKVEAIDPALYRKCDSQEFNRAFVGKYRDVYREGYMEYTFLDGHLIGIVTYSPIMGFPHYEIMKAEERAKIKRESPN